MSEKINIYMHEYKKEYTHVKTDITLLQTLTV